jgi:hypothetical protein
MADAQRDVEKQFGRLAYTAFDQARCIATWRDPRPWEELDVIEQGSWITAAKAVIVELDRRNQCGEPIPDVTSS